MDRRRLGATARPFHQSARRLRRTLGAQRAVAAGAFTARLACPRLPAAFSTALDLVHCPGASSCKPSTRPGIRRVCRSRNRNPARECASRPLACNARTRCCSAC
jgi:hypothetical protein